MFNSWFGSGSSAAAAETGKPAGEEQPAEAKSDGMFSGAFSFVKGMFGVENLKVEETGEATSGDVEDENKRKGLFSQLSSYIGKDVTSMISLPVWVFEPVSFLQVMSEPLQYEDLLVKADMCESSLDRLALVAAFNCALYSTAIRTRKPFNPLLGETFEIVHTDKFKFIAEQVCHHPPIGVSETSSKHYTLQLETELKSKFYGNSSEVIILGMNHANFATSGEHVTWGHLITACHNIILGSLWLDHYGDLSIENHTTGDKVLLKFSKAGWLGAGRYNVTGDILDKDGKVRIKLHGKWNQALYGNRVDDNGKVGEDYLIWEATKEVVTNKHKFPKFVLEEVVNLTPELEAILPPTDSRLREDRRALEAGDLEKAAKSKHEMEEAQRGRKKDRESNNETWTTKYFEQEEDAKFGHRWRFNGKYWVEREEREQQLKKHNNDKQEKEGSN
jgi:hypothetical protein